MSLSQQALVPVLFYPLKALFVDDNIDVITSYTRLFADKFEIHTTTSSLEAWSILENTEFLEALCQRKNQESTRNSLTDSIQEQYIEELLNNIRDMFSVRNSPSNYRILVTDYEMPGLNGIELCQKLKDANIIKILLTGKYESSDAVKALNSNIIDCYIYKGDSACNQQIDFYINNLTYKYFLNLTNRLCNFAGNNPFSFLADPHFADLFKNKINEFNISSYCLVSETGSFLLRNSKHQYILAVYTDYQLDEFCEMFEHEAAINTLISGVKTRESLPFFGIGRNVEDVDFKDWPTMFYPCNKHGKYLWSILPVG